MSRLNTSTGGKSEAREAPPCQLRPPVVANARIKPVTAASGSPSRYFSSEDELFTKWFYRHCMGFQSKIKQSRIGNLSLLENRIAIQREKPCNIVRDALVTLYWWKWALSRWRGKLLSEFDLLHQKETVLLFIYECKKKLLFQKIV